MSRTFRHHRHIDDGPVLLSKRDAWSSARPLRHFEPLLHLRFPSSPRRRKHVQARPAWSLDSRLDRAERMLRARRDPETGTLQNLRS